MSAEVTGSLEDTVAHDRLAPVTRSSAYKPREILAMTVIGLPLVLIVLTSLVAGMCMLE